MNSEEQDQAISAASEAVANADTLIITAGAGMGVDSGLPDFRGTDGFWNAYPHAKKLGLSFPDLANPQWFTEDPELAWGFYGHRAHLYADATPHDGFKILKKWSEQRPFRPFVFTSNVDGHFQQVGFEDVWECHGSILFAQCSKPCCHDIWPLSSHMVPEIDMDSFRAIHPLPTCPHCDSISRPNVLMFGDYGWLGNRQEDQQHNFNRWNNQLVQEFDLDVRVTIIEMGAGTAIPTVRYFSEMKRSAFHGTLIRINPREPEISDGEGISIRSGALEALKAIDAKLVSG